MKSWAFFNERGRRCPTVRAAPNPRLAYAMVAGCCLELVGLVATPSGNHGGGNILARGAGGPQFEAPWVD